MRLDDKNKNSDKNFAPQKVNNGNLNIHSCCESGDLSGVLKLLASNPLLINERNILILQTPLHAAAGHNRIEIVNHLLGWRGSTQVDLEASNVFGETPLHFAAKNGCHEAARLLLNRGANVEAKTNNLMTPLHLAVGYALRSGDSLAVKTLTEFKADSSVIDDEGLTPLHYLPSGYEQEELRRLLSVDSVQSSYNSTANIGNSHNNNNIDCHSYNNNQYVGAPKNPDNEIRQKMAEFDKELSKIVGLHDLKMQLQKWAKGMFLDEKRRAMGMNLGPRKPPHMAFLGNPGTGKTTVARILGKLLHSVGVLSSDTVTEVQRTDLIGEYLGQTGPKTQKKIEEAIGGILFIDEAYRLVPEQKGTGHTEYGVEALEEIMSVLEDGKLVVVFAGYTEPMKRVFSSNEGFTRRVTHFFEFDDFSCKDLAEMLMLKVSDQDEHSQFCGFRLHPSCTFNAIVSVIEKNSSEKLRNKMNGGLVDHILNNARENLDSRLTFESNGSELFTITLNDLEAGLKVLSQRVKVE